MNNGKQISIRLTPADVSMIEACVQKGYAMNVVDFVRQAVREKYADLGVEAQVKKTTQVVFGGA